MSGDAVRATAASLIASTAEAAFASDGDGRIVAWNAAAECLFGVATDQALGRPCHEVVSGLDVFGNPYCRARCTPLDMVRCAQPVRDFQLDVKNSSAEVIRVEFSVVAIGAADSPGECIIVHLVRRLESPFEADHSLELMPKDVDRIGRPRRKDSSLLTRREIEVLRSLAEGSSPTEIAALLFVSIHTVRTHLRNVLHKLEVRKRSANPVFHLA